MTPRMDFDDQLRAWADLGDERLPAQYLNAAIAQIETMPQRRLRPGWLRFPPMNRFVPFALAATALVVVALIGISLFVRSPNVGPSPVPEATPEPTLQAAVWTAAGQMIDDHFAHTATVLPDGRVLVAGGPGEPPTGSAELYDPATGSWTATGDMISGGYDFTTTVLPDGNVLKAGGLGDGDVRLASAELYDPATGSWTVTANLGVTRRGHSATLLPDGTVLVAGGADTASAELFDPSTGTWTSTADMDRVRAYHTATLLPDGMVLVAGGGDGDGERSAELYDVRTGTWSATGSMIHGRADYVATLLPNGTVLVAGGWNGDSARSAELYDPESGTWTATGPMIDGRVQHKAVVLPDGTVLVTGGGFYNEAEELIDLASVELYDPERGTWTATASMEQAHRNHTATLLPDGTVLVAGGTGDDRSTETTAELYRPGLGD